MKLYIDHDTYVDNLGGYDPDDSWSRDSTSSSHDVRSISLSEKGGYEDIEVGDHFAEFVGKRVWLVWSVSSSGDSFGHDNGHYIDFIDVFTSEEAASVCDRTASACNGNRVSLINDTGKKWEYTNSSWTDYFGGRDFVETESFILEA